MTARALLGLFLLCLACEPEPRDAPPAPSLAPPPPSSTAPATTSSTGAPAPCSAPSLAGRDPLDARSEADAPLCRSAATGPARAAERCGQGDPPPLDLARLDSAVRPFDDATAAEIRRIAARGRDEGRRAEVFGLVGDSMTISGDFMRPLASDDTTALAPELAPLAAVLAHYRGVEAERLNGVPVDSFRASRAAAIGARASWPLAGGAAAPLRRMIERLSPAVAIVLYGGNDAAFRVAPLDDIAAAYERDMNRLIDALIDEGIVPVLNTVARHGDAYGFDDCAPPGQMSDWRMLLQTNAINARLVDIACRRHLPLIDLRHAMDAADNRGIGSDGVHPSRYHRGAGVLDARGLRCGYNVRNYVTLLMLRRLLPLVSDR